MKLARLEFKMPPLLTDAEIEEVLDVETGSLTPETLLAEVDEWDSIAALSLIVMLDEKFEKQ